MHRIIVVPNGEAFHTAVTLCTADVPKFQSGEFMENLDLAVLRQLRDWRLMGRPAVLATVLRTWGSSPRPVGSILAISERMIVGSVSGGCIEDDLLERFGRDQRTDNGQRAGPMRVTYGIDADEAHRFGLPCGGTVDILLEFHPNAVLLEELVRSLEAGSLMQRTIRLDDGTVTQMSVVSPVDFVANEREVSVTFGPGYRMLVIGAGQIADCLITMAQFSGFAVTLCDPRDEYRSNVNLAGVTLLGEMPDDAVLRFRPDSRSCVVAVSHDPKLDDLALLEALRTSAFYIGAIGSRRNAKARRERMLQFCFQTETTIARLRGPIGIYIGSKTPPEIAVSVMAEILAEKNGVVFPDGATVETAKAQKQSAS